MMRKVTVIWICLSNLVFAGFVLQHVSQERSVYLLLETKMPWKTFFLPSVIVGTLLLGMISELFDSKFAFFVNAGFFLLSVTYAVDVLVHASQEPEARIFGLLLGIPSFLVLVIDVLLYWRKTRVKKSGVARR